MGAQLGSSVAFGPGCGQTLPGVLMVLEEVAVLVVLGRRHCRAVGAVVCRAVDDEVPGAVEEEAGPAAVRGAVCRGDK